MTYAQQQSDLAAGRLTTLQLVQYYLDRIHASRSLNAYVEVWAEEALATARKQDERRQRGEALGPLAGVVVSLKDVICYRDHRVTASSRILGEFVSLYSATAVERLLAADAILIGRTNCDEFAMGSTNEHSAYGPVRNAADPSRVPGGSSGGAAVSVQADTCMVALGSDTGGSVRQPADFCGVIGLKPTYGRISRHGLLAYGSSFDQIGLLSKDAAAIALVLGVIAGADDYDATAVPQPVPDYTQRVVPDRPWRIAYLAPALEHPSLDAGIREHLQAQIAQWQGAGMTVAAVDFEWLDYIVPAYYVLTTAEASSNLSRYDGMRYGYRSAQAATLEDTYLQSRSEGFGAEVKRRIMLGTFVLSAGYYEAYYGRAQRVRRLIRDRLTDIFADYDFLLLPVSPTPAWPLGATADDPVANYLADIFTVLANLAGVPALSLPTGQHPESGLPIGYQLMAAPWQEAALLSFGREIMA